LACWRVSSPSFWSCLAWPGICSLTVDETRAASAIGGRDWSVLELLGRSGLRSDERSCDGCVPSNFFSASFGSPPVIRVSELRRHGSFALRCWRAVG
jgi:hypothetical protein